jgi:hypothetical protein
MSVLTVRKGAFVPGTVQNLATGSSSVTSSAVGANTTIIRVTVTQDTYVEIIEADATTDSMLMTGGSTEFLAVVPGVTTVSALQVSSAGTISITELGGYNQPGSYGSANTYSPGAPYVSGT